MLATMHRKRLSIHRRLLLMPPERLPNLVIQRLELASDLFLRLRVWRLELHLRQLVYDVAGGIADLRTTGKRTGPDSRSNQPWQKSCRSSPPPVDKLH